jgi:hypothetical protein
MENSTVEDTRKKRDNREVVAEGHSTTADEKSKKIRARRQHIVNHDSLLDVARAQSTANCSSKVSESHHEDSVGNAATQVSSLTGSKSQNDEHGNKDCTGPGKAVDLESALHHIVQLSDGIKEYITDNVWISFRVGHAGDASALAACVRKSSTLSNTKDNNNCSLPTPISDNKKKSTSLNGATASPEDTSLEVRLADGLGDEDTPPSIFALLVDISKKDDEPRLGAAALFSTGWDDVSRILLVEWFYIDDQEKELAGIIQRRLWLRLCTLSVMTSCNKIVGKKSSTTV